MADTLRSVASQDYDNVEHLIVDGASTDATLQIVEQWRPEYGSVKVLRVSSSPDKGIYDAMNKGLKMAKGEIVGILNSDDYFSTETSLSTLIDAFDDDTDAVYADLHYIMDERPDLVVRYYSSRVFSRRKMLMGFQPALLLPQTMLRPIRTFRHRLQGGRRLRATAANDLQRPHTHAVCALRLRNDAHGRCLNLGHEEPPTDYARPH